MSEFKEPTKVIVNPQPYITSLLEGGLEKDLHDNEELCETCKGTGIVLDNNSYGLSGDPKHSGVSFPYKHQSITFCPNCYNGVVRRCPHCRRILPRGCLRCACKKAKEEMDAEYKAKREVQFSKAEAHGPESLGTTFDMVFVDDMNGDKGYFSDWDSFFAAWTCETPADESPENRPKYAWGTYAQDISLNADNILEQATEELHESARDNIGKDMEDELQTFLNDWCRRVSGCKTYFPDEKHKVEIPWELFIEAKHS